MSGLKTVLIVGGGIGGMSAAIALSRAGVQVELIDIDPEWRVSGAGLTLTGPTLRAFKQLGILDAVQASAYTGEGIQICTAAGAKIERLPTALLSDPGIPGSGGILRPVLHSILSQRVKQIGVGVRLGLSVSALEEEETRITVRFTDGTTGRFDLVIGADGLFSQVRRLTRPDAPAPSYTGQSVWRLMTTRLPDVDCRHYFLGGPCKVGLTPVSATKMYLFCLEVGPRRPPQTNALLAETLRGLLAPYGGQVAQVRAVIDERASIVLRPLEAFLLPPPWRTRRTLLVGDAAHPTTPQLASGAGMAVEDALVLEQEATCHSSLELVLKAFMSRRYPRCSLIVQNSLAIGRLEQSGAPIADQTRLVQQSLRALAAPI